VVSNHLVHRARPGTLVHLEQAEGEFVLPESPTPAGKLLFVTAGSGITPVIGMLRNLFPSTDSGVLKPARSRPRHRRRPRRAERARLDLPARPPQALDAAGAINLVERYDDEHGVLDVDRPRPSSCPTSPTARRTPAARPACSTRSRAPPRREGPPLFTEQFRTASSPRRGRHGHLRPATGQVVEADGATPILDAAEEAGVLMPSGCRMGICTAACSRSRRAPCATCATARSPPPSPARPARGVKIQTCINAAAGACHLDH
jgi:hypothetical protein